MYGCGEGERWGILKILLLFIFIPLALPSLPLNCHILKTPRREEEFRVIRMRSKARGWESESETLVEGMGMLSRKEPTFDFDQVTFWKIKRPCPYKTFTIREMVNSNLPPFQCAYGHMDRVLCLSFCFNWI